MSKFSAKMKNGKTITAVVDGRVLTVDDGHVNYIKLHDAYKAGDADEFVKLYDTISSISNTLSSKSGGKAELRGETIYYAGSPLHNEMSRRMIQIVKEGENIEYLLLFIENLMSNPSKRAIDELYNFLSHKNLPITEDGCFLAYKCVRENYLDKHSGKFNNSPGAILEMPRNSVDDNCNNTCSYGFHAGSLEYSGPNGSFWHATDKVIIVKINPADVVSIPADYNAQKLRTCKYEVVAEYKSPLNHSVYSGAGVNDDEWTEDEYESYDDEVEVDDIYMDVNDLEEGDLISFDYAKDGNVTRRHAEVNEIDWNNSIVRVQLAHPESNAGAYRSFLLDNMENVLLKS